MSKLYKVKIETDIMVVADNEKYAIEIAKKNAPSEVGIYGKGSAQLIRLINEIPEDWKSVIPYAQEGRQETKKYFEIVNVSNNTETKKELPPEDIAEIIKISTKSMPPKSIEIKPETRSDPKPKELDWHDTKSGKPMPSLRFIR